MPHACIIKMKQQKMDAKQKICCGKGRIQHGECGTVKVTQNEMPYGAYADWLNAKAKA